MVRISSVIPRNSPPGERGCNNANIIAILIPEKSNNGREPSIVSVGDIETSTKASLSVCPFCTKYILGITDMAINSKIPAPIPKIRVLLCFLV